MSADSADSVDSADGEIRSERKKLLVINASTLSTLCLQDWEPPVAIAGNYELFVSLFSFLVGSDAQNITFTIKLQMISLEQAIPVNLEQLEMHQRIHLLLDEWDTETVVSAIQEYIAREECGQESSPLKAPKPISKEVVPEKQVAYLLEHALEFPEEERAERLANIIGAILERDVSRRAYRPVFLDYFDKHSEQVTDYC